MFQHVLDLPQKLQGWKTELDAFAAKQPPSVEVAVATGSGALQGGLIGAAMASLSVIEPAAAAGVPVMPKARAADAVLPVALRALCVAYRGARRELIAPRTCRLRAWSAGPWCSAATSQS